MFDFCFRKLSSGDTRHGYRFRKISKFNLNQTWNFILYNFLKKICENLRYEVWSIVEEWSLTSVACCLA